MIDLGCASLPAPEPWLTRAVQGALEELPPYAHTHGDYPAGLPALRAMIAERYTLRGIPTMPEQIMVTTGAMGAIDAICHLFAGRGERVAVESPSYANILQLMREAGARLVPVAMADGLSGWDMDRWRQVLRDAAPRLAYVVADFHNPTGALAGDDQRRQLVDAARSAGTVLVADETMTELWLEEGVDMPRPVCGFDPAGSTVITVGSASKAFWAGMRIGWVRAAPDVIRSLVAARAYADLGTPVLEQLAVNWLFSTGGWEQAVDIRRAQARENRDALVGALRRHLPDWEFEVPRGGLTLWVRTGGLSGSRLAEMGERVGLRVPSGPRFGVDGAFEGYVRLPFTVGGAVAEEAAVRLAAAARLVENGVTGAAIRRAPSWRSRVSGRPVPVRAGDSRPPAPEPGFYEVSATAASTTASVATVSSASAGVVRGGSRARTAWRCASFVASSYGSGVAGTWSRWTGPLPRRAYPRPGAPGRPAWCAGERRAPPPAGRRWPGRGRHARVCAVVRRR